MTTRGCACYRSLDEESESFPGLCFFESEWEEKIYDAPAPSEDIWKKFELLPTPPVSPKHETTYPTVTKYQMDLDDVISQTDFSLESLIGLSEDCHICSPLDKTDHNLKSNLIQDCMWSGQNVFAKDLRNITAPITENTATLVALSTSTSTLDINASTDCVDPASVFPYPINEPREPDNLGAETPSDSEDEEIDVVTVNDIVQITRRRPILPAAPTMSAQVAAMHNYNAPASSAPHEPRTTPVKSPRCHKSPSGVMKRHRQKTDSDNGENHPPLKKLRLHMSTNNQLRSVVRKLRQHTHSSRAGGSGGGGGGSTCSSSQSNSDSEDGECRRSQHNILERKRRNDLKYSFQLLRQNVPDLGLMDKTPKVTILKKASDFIMGLRAKEVHLRKQVDTQRQKQEQLKRRLRALRQSVPC